VGSPFPVIFVSHDETLIERTANVVIHLEKVRKKTLPRHTIARMPYRQYIDERLSRFEHQEQLANKEREEYDRKMAKYRQIEAKVEHQQNAISRQDPSGGRLLKKKMHAVKSMGRRFEREKGDMTEHPDTEEAILLRFQGTTPVPSGKTVLELDLPELRIGDTVLARNLRLHVSGGEKLCITGRNGAGKTTLLRRIADELCARNDIRAAYMPQNYEELLDETKTPVAFLSRTGFKEETTRIRTWLGSMKFTAEEMARPIAELSGGQKAKLFFTKMNLDGANV
jgi:ATPase subunit of ABC transporter with duplicated ATPase domains